MAFFETLFPREIGFASSGGSAWSTTVNAGFSGAEQRNSAWATPKGKWTIILQGKPQSYFDLVYKFWLNVRGMGDGFRFEWPIDHIGAKEFIAIADGSSNPVFQLQKSYQSGGRTFVRIIKKPVMSTVLDHAGNFLQNSVVMYDEGTPLVVGSDFTVDATTGLVTFLYTPSYGNEILADFRFHYPVRFSMDDMANASIIPSDVQGGHAVIDWSQIGLEEIRL